MCNLPRKKGLLRQKTSRWMRYNGSHRGDCEVFGRKNGARPMGKFAIEFTETI